MNSNRSGITMGNDTEKTVTDTRERQQSAAAAAFARLSQREKVLIYALIVIGAAVALVMLLIMPALDNIRTLEEEALQAETTRQEYVQVIAEGAGADAEIEEAQAAYDAAREKLYSPMTPEQLDQAVTKFLVKAGFDPSTLTLSELATEDVTPFSPVAISDAQAAVGDSGAEAGVTEEGDTGDSGVTATDEGAAVADGGATADADGGATADDTAATDETATTDETIPVDMTGGEQDPASGSIRSYTVGVTAVGGWSNLYKLLAAIDETDGVAITQYAYTESTDPDKVSKGSFSMTIKFYVFVESAA
jgi:cell division protein FtsL